MKMRPKDLWKRLMVKFRGEEGLDYGGVARLVSGRQTNHCNQTDSCPLVVPRGTAPQFTTAEWTRFNHLFC